VAVTDASGTGYVSFAGLCVDEHEHEQPVTRVTMLSLAN